MLQIKSIEGLPDNPMLYQGGYIPQVEIWKNVVWTLNPENIEDIDLLLDINSKKPNILLIGCSYMSGNTLPISQRLLYCLRKKLSDFTICSIATPGAGLLTGLAHITKFLPKDYSPQIVLFTPSQTIRQYIPESTIQFNANPYGLWQHFYWLEYQNAKKKNLYQEELCRRDCLRINYLMNYAFPASFFLITLFDSSETDEITLLQPYERIAIEKLLSSNKDRYKIVLNRKEMLKLYHDLGPFKDYHPNSRQVEFWADHIAYQIRYL